MTVYRVALAFGEVFAVPRACPNCGTADLTATVVDERTTFRCPRCDQRWVCEPGRIEPAESSEKGVPSVTWYLRPE